MIDVNQSQGFLGKAFMEHLVRFRPVFKFADDFESKFPDLKGKVDPVWLFMECLNFVLANYGKENLVPDDIRKHSIEQMETRFGLDKDVANDVFILMWSHISCNDNWNHSFPVYSQETKKMEEASFHYMQILIDPYGVCEPDASIYQMFRQMAYLPDEIYFNAAKGGIEAAFRKGEYDIVIKILMEQQDSFRANMNHVKSLFDSFEESARSGIINDSISEQIDKTYKDAIECCKAYMKLCESVDSIIKDKKDENSDGTNDVFYLKIGNLLNNMTNMYGKLYPEIVNIHGKAADSIAKSIGSINSSDYPELEAEVWPKMRHLDVDALSNMLDRFVDTVFPPRTNGFCGVGDLINALEPDDNLFKPKNVEEKPALDAVNDKPWVNLFSDEMIGECNKFIKDMLVENKKIDIVRILEHGEKSGFDIKTLSALACRIFIPSPRCGFQVRKTEGTYDSPVAYGDNIEVIANEE